MVTLAIGRSVARSRPHSSWPLAASASTAPLAFTPPGVPVTWITGLAGGRGRADAAGGREGASAAGSGVPAVAACLAEGRGCSPLAAGAHAATPTAMTATAGSETIRTLSRMLLASH